jgi:hypothetical protein
MRRDEEKIDPQQPALIVTCGMTKRKHRPLDRDVVVLGRAPGCDLGLVAPDIAPVHCILVRLPDGWRVRDCAGRHGTRVNGKAVQDEPLRDGDIIQIGSFSFEAHLPRSATPSVGTTPSPAGTLGAVSSAPSAEAEAQLKRLKRSRLNLAHHALRLRRRLRECQLSEAELDQRQADLDHQECRLRALHRETEEKRRAAEAERAQAQQPASSLPVSPAPPCDDTGEMDRRQQELNHYAAHLRRWAERLRAQDVDCAAGLQEQARRRDERLDELAQQLEQLRQEVEEDARATYEAELARLRAEGEQQRSVLEQQLAWARERLAEVEERLERERALPPRAPTQLDRPSQQTRVVRDAEPAEDGVMNKLESVRRLRQELAERRQTGKGPRSRQLRRLPAPDNAEQKEDRK